MNPAYSVVFLTTLTGATFFLEGFSVFVIFNR